MYQCVFRYHLFLDHRRISDHRVWLHTTALLSVVELTRSQLSHLWVHRTVRVHHSREALLNRRLICLTMSPPLSTQTRIREAPCSLGQPRPLFHLSHYSSSHLAATVCLRPPEASRRRRSRKAHPLTYLATSLDYGRQIYPDWGGDGCSRWSSKCFRLICSELRQLAVAVAKLYT